MGDSPSLLFPNANNCSTQHRSEGALKMFEMGFAEIWRNAQHRRSAYFGLWKRNYLPEQNMEARMHFRHIVAIAALLIFSFGVTVFFFSKPIADAAVWHTHQVRSDANLNVSPIGQPPYP